MVGLAPRNATPRLVPQPYLAFEKSTKFKSKRPAVRKHALLVPARVVLRADYPDGSAESIDVGGSDGTTKSLKERYCAA